MPLFKPSAASFKPSNPTSTRAIAREILAHRLSTTSFPVTSECPSPTCPCAEMPSGLDIDRSATLNGTMAPYTRHILVSTGKHDWKSKIEHEDTVPGQLIRDLKARFGRGGDYHDPYKNTLITASSFGPGSESVGSTSTQSSIFGILDFPSFKQIKAIKDQSMQTTQLSYHVAAASYKNLPGIKQLQFKVHRITKPTIFVCSHNSRDSRCGILGPILCDEFRRYLLQRTSRNDERWVVSPNSNHFDTDAINVGSLSHIGGHKWAGNVIIYLPPDWTTGSTASEERHPLAGLGIWYGRVEPRHVEGIVEETIAQGRIIGDLFRGGINAKGEAVRI